MTALNILVVDDEPIALERMQRLLDNIEGTTVVGTAHDGLEALSVIEAVRPQLVLLDVEMPKADGFDVVESLLRLDWDDPLSVPLICFVTAYPQFATNAFDTGALDYLCKPVRLSRLQTTIERAREALRHRDSARRLRQLSATIDELRSTRSSPTERSLWVQRRGEKLRLEVADLDWIEAEGECVRLHFGEKTFLHRSSMEALCAELATRGIIRIHRSIAVNTNKLTAIRKRRDGATVVLKSGAELPVGRSFRRSLESPQSGGSAAVD